MREHSLTPSERLQRKQDFAAAARGGRRVVERHFKLIVCPNRAQTRRLGITASRKVGSAVERNRVKRLIREFFRLNKGLFPPGHDIVVIAREGASELSYQEVDAKLRRLLKGL